MAEEKETTIKISKVITQTMEIIVKAIIVGTVAFGMFFLGQIVNGVGYIWWNLYISMIIGGLVGMWISKLK